MAVRDSAVPDGGCDSDRPDVTEIALRIDFVADAGKQMLESSTSVAEVLDRLRALLPAIGLEGCALDASLNSLTLSYWPAGQPLPITTVREVRVASPRLELLSGTVALLDQVERGAIDVAEAADRLQAMEHAPAQRLVITLLALLVSVSGWVVFLDGLDAVTLAAALLATILTFPIDAVVQRLRLPSLAATFFTALIVAAIPNMLAAAGVPLLVGPAVVGALFIYLPGRAFVSAVIDGLANAPISSVSRGIQAIVVAGFLALGMLVGTEIGTGLGLTFEPNLEATPLVLSAVGSALGVLGLGVAWAMPRRQLLPTVMIAATGWLVVALGTINQTSTSDWPAYALGAGLVGLLGALVSAIQDAPASVYTGVAILPLVPGFALYTGMLAVAQGQMPGAGSALRAAGVISVTIAISVAGGLGVGRNLLAVSRWLSRRPSELAKVIRRPNR